MAWRHAVSKSTKWFGSKGHTLMCCGCSPNLLFPHFMFYLPLLAWLSSPPCSPSWCWLHLLGLQLLCPLPLLCFLQCCKGKGKNCGRWPQSQRRRLWLVTDHWVNRWGQRRKHAGGGGGVLCPSELGMHYLWQMAHAQIIWAMDRQTTMLPVVLLLV